MIAKKRQVGDTRSADYALLLSELGSMKLQAGDSAGAQSDFREVLPCAVTHGPFHTGSTASLTRTRTAVSQALAIRKNDPSDDAGCGFFVKAACTALGTCSFVAAG